MAINPNPGEFSGKNTVYQLLISLLVVIVIGFILFSLLILSGSMIFGTEPGMIGNAFMATDLKQPGFIRYALVMQDLSFFIVPGILIILKMNPGYQNNIFSIKKITVTDIFLVIILSFCAFPLTGLAGQLNSEMTLPGRLSDLEHWMKEKEDFAGSLLEVVMTPETLMGMFLNILIIAAIPAFGEELIFRGVFQKIFHNLFGSGHVAVWVTSFLFSAIHLQFYGFLPRFILGLIFGYLFLWTRNLWLPVTAHFVNNSVPTVLAYIKGWDKINEASSISSGKQIAGLILSITAGMLILIYFRGRSAERIGSYRDGKD